MPLPNVPAPLTDPRFDQVMLHLNAAKAILEEDGFDIALTEEQIRELSVPGDRMTQTVRNSNQAANQFPQSIPPDFPKTEFNTVYLFFAQASQMKCAS